MKGREIEAIHMVIGTCTIKLHIPGTGAQPATTEECIYSQDQKWR
jgi:hypothetical protein